MATESLDSFLWGYFKMKIYTERRDKLHVLKNRIQQEVNVISKEVTLVATSSFYKRLGNCQIDLWTF